MKWCYFSCWPESCRFTTCCLKNPPRRHWWGFVASQIYISFHVIYRGSGKLIHPLQKSCFWNSSFLRLGPPQQRYFFFSFSHNSALRSSHPCCSLMSRQEEKVSFPSGRLQTAGTGPAGGCCARRCPAAGRAMAVSAGMCHPHFATPVPRCPPQALPMSSPDGQGGDGGDGGGAAGFCSAPVWISTPFFTSCSHARCRVKTQRR